MEMCKQVTRFCVIKTPYPIHNSQNLKIIAHYLKQQLAYVLCRSRNSFLIVKSNDYVINMKINFLFILENIISVRCSRMVSDRQLHSIKVKCFVAVCKMFSFYTFIDAQSVQKAVIRINKFVLRIITSITKQSAFAGILYIVCCVLWSLRW